MIAFDVGDGSTQCPIAYQLHAGTDGLTVEIGRYGNLTLEPQEGGSLAVHANATERELGTADTFTETYRSSYEDDEGRQVDVSGNLTIEHFGAWPTDQLEPE